MHLSSVKAHRGTVHTPLRYPGGKTRLAGFLSRTIVAGGWEGCTYVEPYAGGAGAALSLLHAGLVRRVVINDLDPHLHAFWYAITRHPRAFLNRLERTPVTLDEWKRQREIYRAANEQDLIQLGFATFFLNRTNRSGIMNAGVIGGQAQSGRYKIDARYNKSELRSRLEWISKNAGKITICKRDGLDVLADMIGSPRVFSYIDPPYFEKGSFLYLNSFAEEGHASLATLLHSNRDARWVLTYDDVPAIRSLYFGLHQGTFDLPYSAHKASLAKERMVISDPIANLADILS